MGLFFIVLILRSVRYAYESLGVSSNTAIFLPLPATLRQQLGALVLCFVTVSIVIAEPCVSSDRCHSRLPNRDHDSRFTCSLSAMVRQRQLQSAASRRRLDYELRRGRTFAAAKSMHAIRMPSAM